MPQFDDGERRMLEELEHELGNAELTAVLSEWVTASVHRVFAVAVVIGCWRNQLVAQGWAPETVESSLPLILDRLWTVPRGKTHVTTFGGLIEFDDDDDEVDDDD